jgi:hypothetical protein
MRAASIAVFPAGWRPVAMGLSFLDLFGFRNKKPNREIAGYHRAYTLLFLRHCLFVSVLVSRELRNTFREFI